MQRFSNRKTATFQQKIDIPLKFARRLRCQLRYTDKKDNQIFLMYKEIQNGPVAKSYMTNGLLIYGGIFTHFLIHQEALPHIRLCNSSTLNFLIYEERKIQFSFLSVYTAKFIGKQPSESSASVYQPSRPVDKLQLKTLLFMLNSKLQLHVEGAVGGSGSEFRHARTSLSAF